MKIAIVDNHEEFRNKLLDVLFPSQCFDVIASAPDKETLFRRVSSAPDICIISSVGLIFDEQKPVKAIKNKYRKAKILMLPTDYIRKPVAELIYQGAKGYLPRNCSAQELLMAINALSESGSYWEMLSENKLFSDEYKLCVSTMKKLEKRILFWCAAGLSAEQIAAKVNVPSMSVYNKLTGLMQKLQVINREQLVLVALKNNLHK
jgi:two-component system, NarL family, nitrate/nitrite response regulator NarL